MPYCTVPHSFLCCCCVVGRIMGTYSSLHQNNTNQDQINSVDKSHIVIMFATICNFHYYIDHHQTRFIITTSDIDTTGSTISSVPSQRHEPISIFPTSLQFCFIALDGAEVGNDLLNSYAQLFSTNYGIWGEMASTISKFTTPGS